MLFAGRAFPAYMDDPRRQRFSKVRTERDLSRALLGDNGT
jgi:hypothetical protein